MKILIGVLAISLGTTVPASAEHPQRDPQRAERVQQRIQEVENRLALTSDQAERVRPVLADMLEIRRAVQDDYASRDQGRNSRRRMARELRAIQLHADAWLERFLSSAQLDELRTIRREWQD